MTGLPTLAHRLGRQFGLLFDMDDTLIDTSESYDQCIHLLTGASREELLTLRAEGGYNDDWDAAYEILRRRGCPRPLSEIQAEGRALYLQRAHRVEQPIFSRQTLTALADRHPLLIFTGRTRQEYAPVWGQRLDPLFGEVLCKDDPGAGRPKPHPDGLHTLIQRHRLLAGAYLGNSVDDMAAARAAGLIAIGITSNQSEATLRAAGAEYVLGGVDQLLELLGITL